MANHCRVTCELPCKCGSFNDSQAIYEASSLEGSGGNKLLIKSLTELV